MRRMRTKEGLEGVGPSVSSDFQLLGVHQKHSKPKQTTLSSSRAKYCS